MVQNLLGNLPTKRKATVIGECETCAVIFNSTEQEAMHMNGKRHAKKMKSAVVGGEWCYVKISEYEPCCEKTGHQGFQPGPTQTGLNYQRRWRDA